MLSLTEHIEETQNTSTLPPIIYNNIREKINAEQVSIGIKIAHRERQRYEQNEKIENPQQLHPIYPLQLVYVPKVLYFKVEDTATVHRLRVSNASFRSIYITCSGVCNGSACLGISWVCYPRLRSLLAPGLFADFYIKATPKNFANIRTLTLELQLAAAHKSDHIVKYFSVPIVITFVKYMSSTSCLQEDG